MSEERPLLTKPQAARMEAVKAVDGGVKQDCLSTVLPGPVMGEVVWAGQKPFEATVLTPCWVCKQTDQPETLFTPCQCGLVHRHCFRAWRQGWINPRNYFNCKQCMHHYHIERVGEKDIVSEERMRRMYRISIAKLLIGTFLAIVLAGAALAGICYGADTEHKNIPIAVKYLLSSVVNGVPSGNTTTIWEENFQKPNVHVWPYYTLFSIFLTSILVLVMFCAYGLTFDKGEVGANNYRRKDDICCGPGSCNGCLIYQPCPNCSGGGGGSNCSGGGGCGKDAGEAMLVLLLIVVVAIIISAIFVTIFFVLQRCTLVYNRYSDMLMSQAEEIEGETIVLGVDETWRPLNEV